MIESSFISNKTSEISYLFPLYLFPVKEKRNPKPGSTLMMVFDETEPYGKKTNIAPILFEKLEAAYKRQPSPEEIFYYIYGVFYSNIFRETYNEFLKIDFPRVPFTADYELFKKIGKLGKNLADLHLLEDVAVDPPIAKYPVIRGNDKIENIIYKKDQQRVYINEERYFENVAPEVWHYQIGGYQVLQKYLKDRKGRMMHESPHYCKIVTALSKTIEIQKTIDLSYPKIEKTIFEF